MARLAARAASHLRVHGAISDTIDRRYPYRRGAQPWAGRPIPIRPRQRQRKISPPIITTTTRWRSGTATAGAALPAAEIVGPRGHVVGVGVAERLLELGRAKD